MTPPLSPKQQGVLDELHRTGRIEAGQGVGFHTIRSLARAGHCTVHGSHIRSRSGLVRQWVAYPATPETAGAAMPALVPGRPMRGVA